MLKNLFRKKEYKKNSWDSEYPKHTEKTKIQIYFIPKMDKSYGIRF